MKQTIAAKIITLLSLISLSCPAFDGNLSELEIFERCFKRMVRAIPESNDPLWLKVQKGELKGAAACMQLFDKAKFNSSGRIASLNDDQARAIVRSFNDFHGSWFQQRITENGIAQLSRTFGLINDLEEPQLFITRALFAGKAYRSIVTEKKSLHGIRVRPADKKTLSIFRAQRISSYPSDIPELAGVSEFRLSYRQGRERVLVVVPENRMISVGELVGVKEMTGYVLPSIVPVSRTTAAGSPDLSATAIQDSSVNVTVNENFGGGIVGSPVFMLTNANLPPGTKATAPGDQTYNINRVLTSRIYEDLMCHQLPTLTDADVASMLDKKSPHAFHQQSTCMVCHAQIDPLGAVYRNFVTAASDSRLDSEGQKVGLATYAITRLPASAGAKAYAETEPVGYVRYRPFRSAKVSTTKVSSLAEVGATLSDSKDLYECAAKRYYQYFTGIDVPLKTLDAPPASADANAKAKYTLDRKHQALVLELAKGLQTNQSLRSLVQQIVSSAPFKSRDFQSAVEAK